MSWISNLRFDPLPILLASPENALTYFVKKNLLDEPQGDSQILWKLPDVVRLNHHQQSDGSWVYGSNRYPSVPGQNYALLETYRVLRVLVEKYSITREHPAIQKAVDYVFRQQTAEGDIRGIIGNQYMPYYMGAILELVIKAGYKDDPRVSTGLDWLLAMRQNDGGWIVPAQAVPPGQRTGDFWAGDPVQPERTRPNSHLATGMVLRAFAVHPAYQTRPEVLQAAGCLKSRLFKPDHYNDRRNADYWLKYQYPFWWTSLVSALDTLARLGFQQGDGDISRALDWFHQNQQPDGLWPTGYDKGRTVLSNRLWAGFAVCRMMHDFHARQAE